MHSFYPRILMHEEDAPPLLHPVILEVKEDGEKFFYAGTVVHLSPDEEIVIEVATDRPLGKAFPSGEGVRVSATSSDSQWRFESQIIRVETGMMGRVCLLWPEHIDRIQRRENFRLDVALRVKVDVGYDREGERKFIEGRTRDLSAGGARLELDSPLEPNTLVKVHVSFPQIGSRECLSRVVRVGMNGLSSDQPHWAAVQFRDTSPAIQKEIAHFLAQLELERYRRRKRGF